MDAVGVAPGTLGLGHEGFVALDAGRLGDVVFFAPIILRRLAVTEQLVKLGNGPAKMMTQEGQPAQRGKNKKCGKARLNQARAALSEEPTGSSEGVGGSSGCASGEGNSIAFRLSTVSFMAASNDDFPLTVSIRTNDQHDLRCRGCDKLSVCDWEACGGGAPLWHSSVIASKGHLKHSTDRTAIKETIVVIQADCRESAAWRVAR